MGTTEDVSLLKEKLARVLERRKQAYEAGAKSVSGAKEEPEQRVVIFRAPPAFKYDEVVIVIEAIKAAGGSRVGAQQEVRAP